MEKKNKILLAVAAVLGTVIAMFYGMFRSSGGQEGLEPSLEVSHDGRLDEAVLKEIVVPKDASELQDVSAQVSKRQQANKLDITDVAKDSLVIAVPWELIHTVVNVNMQKEPLLPDWMSEGAADHSGKIGQAYISIDPVMSDSFDAIAVVHPEAYVASFNKLEADYAIEDEQDRGRQQKASYNGIRDAIAGMCVLPDGTYPKNIDLVITGIPKVPHLFEEGELVVNLLNSGEKTDFEDGLSRFQRSMNALLDSGAIELLQGVDIKTLPSIEPDERGLVNGYDEEWAVMGQLVEAGTIGKSENGLLDSVGRSLENILYAVSSLRMHPPKTKMAEYNVTQSDYSGVIGREDFSLQNVSGINPGNIVVGAEGKVSGTFQIYHVK